MQQTTVPNIRNAALAPTFMYPRKRVCLPDEAQVELPKRSRLVLMRHHAASDGREQTRRCVLAGIA
jgi:hypothetical protein